MITIDMIDEYSKETEKPEIRRKNETFMEDKNGLIQNGKNREKSDQDRKAKASHSRRLALTSQGLSIRIRWLLGD